MRQVTFYAVMGTSQNRMSRSLLRRWSPALLFAALLALPGCYYYAGGYSYSVYVTAVADYDLVYPSTPVSLNSDYDIDNASVYITDQDWDVVTAPDAAVFVLDDDGRDATLIPVTAGTYVVRYRTWYYTNYDYYDCYCTDYTSYRESYVTIEVVPAPPG